jgi:hypothetical protein
MALDTLDIFDPDYPDKIDNLLMADEMFANACVKLADAVNDANLAFQDFILLRGGSPEPRSFFQIVEDRRLARKYLASFLKT